MKCHVFMVHCVHRAVYIPLAVAFWQPVTEYKKVAFLTIDIENYDIRPHLAGPLGLLTEMFNCISFCW